MENRSFDVEDILDVTDSDDSSSSSNIVAFENQTHLIMDVHEIKKDDTNAESSAPDNKVKKLKKKKKVKQLTDRIDATISSASTTEVNSLAAGPEDVPKEEFFDAHESYHVISGSQTPAPMAGVNLSHAASDHQQSKVTSEQTSTAQPLAVVPETDKKSSVISKPVTRTE